jgi:hypothetical protein
MRVENPKLVVEPGAGRTGELAMVAYQFQQIDLVLMQDGAPGHAAGDTIRELRERGITVIFWPPFSPDLNPIERVWHIMKNWLQDHYPEENISYDRLRIAVKQAWEVVGEHEFKELIESMHDRCQAVIDADGLFTKY